MLTLNDAIAKKMEDPEFKAEWDALEPEFQIIRAIIEGREGQMGAEDAEAKENETDEEAAAE